MNAKVMTSDQCRAARSILALTQIELAAAAGMKKQTIADVESGKPTVRHTTLAKLRSVFITLGISFLDDEVGIGVKRQRTLSEFEDWNDERAARCEQEAPSAHSTPAQCRAARGLLNWNIAKLANASGVGTTAIREYESGRRRLRPNNLAAVESALAEEGVEFTDEGRGVRLAAWVRLHNAYEVTQW